MISRLFHVATEEDCQLLASQLAPCLSPPLVLTFSGEIGAGKTTFVRSLLRALGEVGAVRSPTFSLVESYQCKDLTLHHFDLYRINDVFELDFIGFRDYFSPQSICCIEWPERADNQLNQVDITLNFVIQDTGRQINAQALSQSGFSVMSSWIDTVCKPFE